MDVKKCKGCERDLPISRYYKHSTTKDRLRPKCKSCMSADGKIRERRFYYSKSGYLSRKWKDMNYRCNNPTERWMYYLGKECLPRKEFIAWAENNEDFIELWDAWKQSGYVRSKCPSIDRIDPRFGYELFNMQWVTLSENSKRACAWKNFSRIV